MNLLTSNKSAVSPFFVCICRNSFRIIRLWFMHCSIVLFLLQIPLFLSFMFRRFGSEVGTNRFCIFDGMPVLEANILCVEGGGGGRGVFNECGSTRENQKISAW